VIFTINRSVIFAQVEIAIRFDAALKKPNSYPLIIHFYAANSEHDRAIFLLARAKRISIFIADERSENA